MAMTERQLQEKILKLIRSDQLSQTIEQSEDILRLVEEDDAAFPSFSIDHLVGKPVGWVEPFAKPSSRSANSIPFAKICILIHNGDSPMLGMDSLHHHAMER
jgi:hypothetical protein